MKHSFKTKTIYNHFVAVLIFIGYEQGTLALGGVKVSPVGAIAYYVADVSCFYFLTLYMLPLVISERKRLLRIALGLPIGYILFFVLQLLAGGVYGLLKQDEFLIDVNWEIARNVTVRFLYIVEISFVYYLVRKGIRKAKESANLKVANLELENAYLQSKINPHLLFNTLNYVTHLIGRQSERASTIVLRLSEVLNYGLHQNHTSQHVPLKEELEQLENYLELIRLRNNEDLQLVTNLSVSSQVLETPIPPMLFISCMDNLFKHGNLHDHAMPARLEIFDHKGLLHFNLFNPKKETFPGQGQGTGLEYMRKRLERFFAGRYRLEINDTMETYELNLIIQL